MYLLYIILATTCQVKCVFESVLLTILLVHVAFCLLAALNHQIVCHMLSSQLEEWKPHLKDIVLVQ